MRSISLMFVGAVLAAAGTANASILYSASVQTVSRFNPGLNALGTATGPTQQDQVFDDVPIANPLNFPQVSITRVTFGIRRVGAAPAVDINFFATSLTTPTGTQTLSDALDFPFTSLGSASLLAVTASVTQLVVQDFTGSPILMNLNNTILSPTGGLGTLGIGLQFSGVNAANAANGWRLTTPDVGSVNANQLGWIYDTDLTNPKNAFSFGVPSATVPPTTFYIIVEGDLVPAPGAAALLGLGGLVAARRRRA